MFSKLSLTVLLLISLGMSGVALGQEPKSDAEIVEIFAVKAVRLIMASAYQDPALVLQEVDSLKLEFERFEQVLAKDPERVGRLDEFRNITDMFRLYLLSEFGMVQDFKEKAEPMLAKSPNVNHRIAMWVLGFRSAYQAAQEHESRYFLTRAQQELENVPTDQHVYPVDLYILASLETLQEKSEGKELTAREMSDAFDEAWGHLDNYRPDDDMASNATWYHGRFVTKMWLRELAQTGELGDQSLQKMFRTLASWEDTKLKLTGGDEDVDTMQGFITLALGRVDIILTLLEERPDFLDPAKTQVVLQAMDVYFRRMGLLADKLSKNLSREGFVPLDYSQSALMSELRVRHGMLVAVNSSAPVSEKLSELGKLSAGFDQSGPLEPYLQNYVRLGLALRQLSQPELAIGAWETAFGLAEEKGYRRLATRVATLLHLELKNTGDWERASLYAAKVSQIMTDGVALAETSELLTQNRGATHDEATAYLRSSHPQKALEALDRGKQVDAAALLLSSDSEAKQAAQGLAKSERTVTRLGQTVSNLKQLPDSVTRDEMLDSAERVLADSRASYLSESRKVRARFPQLYSATLRFDPLDLVEVQKSLGTGVTAVQYFPTEKELYIFVVDRSRFRLKSVPISSRVLEESVESFHHHIKRLSAEETKLARELYKVLIAPVESEIKDSQQLVLIPTGKLNLLPFGALLNERMVRLTESKRLVQLAKTTDFLRIANSEVEKIEDIMVFTNPTLDLPASDSEGESILGLFPGSQQFRGVEASKANLLKFGPQGDVLHLATHGVWNAHDSLKNHLLLSDKEHFAQEEIFSLDLAETSVVTLSACDTAVGDSDQVGYVSSLAEAFWIAGTRTVVASLWPVEDRSTQILMTNFYSGIKAGKGRSESLRMAQQKVRVTAGYAHPYYWSGFVVFGDYR